MMTSACLVHQPSKLGSEHADYCASEILHNRSRSLLYQAWNHVSVLCKRMLSADDRNVWLQEQDNFVELTPSAHTSTTQCQHLSIFFHSVVLAIVFFHSTLKVWQTSTNILQKLVSLVMVHKLPQLYGIVNKACTKTTCFLAHGNHHTLTYMFHVGEVLSVNPIVCITGKMFILIQQLLD